MSGGHIVLGTAGSDLFEAVITAEAAIEGAAAWSVICWLHPERSGTELLVSQETAYEKQQLFADSYDRFVDATARHLANACVELALEAK